MQSPKENATPPESSNPWGSLEKTKDVTKSLNDAGESEIDGNRAFNSDEKEYENPALEQAVDSQSRDSDPISDRLSTDK